ncbi:MAG: NDP-sugar synthase [Candidatus Omnitrophota bacterium]|nr:NDP-sugar synthase [Candidatus Omnitrophota bacterium]MBU2527885.1 NDP-sugar synthase [bacterium]MBU3929238.1 NDP-sugar synthase [bacterium]MBU4123637.1 NDP-sugar synthase [bacterium]
MKQNTDSDIRVMVLAAGVGTRLRPLTYRIPKPLIPIVNRPVMEHSISNLQKQGFRKFICNLHTHAGKIRKHFGTGKKLGVSMEYSLEKTLLGNAGGLKKVEGFFKGSGTLLVISGDGFTDIDIRKAVAFHRKKKSAATMVLKKVESTFPFGITLTNPAGKITKFMEKPCITDFVDATVNTGIYIFEQDVFKFIPKNNFFDFGRDLWPLLLKNKLPIYGYVTDAYWCDVGNLPDYRRTVADVLDGKVNIKIPGRERHRSVWCEKNVKIGKNVKFYRPCLIGENSEICDGAKIGPFVTIGRRSTIGPSAVVKNSIIWDNARIDGGVKIKNCIIDSGAAIKENLTLYEGTVINTEDRK